MIQYESVGRILLDLVHLCSRLVLHWINNRCSKDDSFLRLSFCQRFFRNVCYPNINGCVSCFYNLHICNANYMHTMKMCTCIEPISAEFLLGEEPRVHDQRRRLESGAQRDAPSGPTCSWRPSKGWGRHFWKLLYSVFHHFSCKGAVTILVDDS